MRETIQDFLVVGDLVTVLEEGDFQGFVGEVKDLRFTKNGLLAKVALYYYHPGWTQFHTDKLEKL